MKTTLVCVATIIFLFGSLCSVLVQADGNLIYTTCKKTPNYQLCVSTLNSDRRSRTTDVPGLALILVNKIAAKATHTLNRINYLRKGRSNDKSALNECAENYSYGVLKGDVPMAIEALTKGDYKFAEQGANDAANEAHDCEGKFTSGSPISDLNKSVHDLSVVAASIVRTLL